MVVLISGILDCLLIIDFFIVWVWVNRFNLNRRSVKENNSCNMV